MEGVGLLEMDSSRVLCLSMETALPLSLDEIRREDELILYFSL